MSSGLSDASISGKYPSQDGIDRSNQFAVILAISLEPWEVMRPNFDWEQLHRTRPDYRAWIEEVQTEISQEFQAREFEIDHYQVGPAAGGMIDNVQMIATFIQHAAEIYGVIELGKWAISLTRGIKRKATRWKNEQEYESLEVGEAYPPLMLKYMVIGYLMDFHQYEPIGEVFIECLSVEFYDGYSSPSHPTRAVEYLVIAPTEGGAFRMKVTGDSRIHYLKLQDMGPTRLLPTLPYLNDLLEVDDRCGPHKQ